MPCCAGSAAVAPPIAMNDATEIQATSASAPTGHRCFLKLMKYPRSIVFFYRLKKPHLPQASPSTAERTGAGRTNARAGQCPPDRPNGLENWSPGPSRLERRFELLEAFAQRGAALLLRLELAADVLD